MMKQEKREMIIREFERFVQEYSVEYTDYNKEVLKGALALLKAQEHPTETEVEEARKMSLYALKAREPKMVTGVAEIYKDILVGNCPSCGQTVVSNVKKPTKYCRFCGRGVKWE